MLAHTDAVVTRIRTIPALAEKTFLLVAPRDSEGTVTAVPPYVVVQPGDDEDEFTRLGAGRTERTPRLILHIVGASYTNSQTVTEFVKALFVTAGGYGIQIDVTGEKGRNIRWSPQPTQVDNDVTPPLIYTTVELTWKSEPTS